MSKLPLLISVPHAGLLVPRRVKHLCALTEQEIADDGDGGAAEIYDIAEQVESFVTTGVARAIVDMNRSESDRHKDGVIKTHTCWDVPVYHEPPSEELVESLLEKYHRPYHRRLRELANNKVVLGIDCHTMAKRAPPVAPDPGAIRPAVCLGNADGTCPQEWIEVMADFFSKAFAGLRVTINTPFRGGYITRTHAAEMPWIQLELSRDESLLPVQKRKRVLFALRHWCSHFRK